MQRQNLNQQSPHYRRRKCISYKPNDFFQYFQDSQRQIIADYQISSQLVMIDSLTILIQNMRSAGKQDHESPLNLKKINSGILQTFAKNNLTFKKQVPSSNSNQQQQTNPQKQVKQFVHFQKTGQKQTKSTKKVEFCVQQKYQQANYAQTKKHEKLINSLKRLSVSEDFRLLQEEIQNIPENRKQSQDTNLMKFDQDQLKNKSITQLLQQSYAKSKKMVQKCNSPIQSQNSEYQMTDHESNESSNDDDDYQQRYLPQGSATPLFGTIFAGGGKNNFPGKNLIQKGQQPSGSLHHLPHPKLNFKALLNSPKKEKTKKKRLFINKKKVPKWAQDLKQVQKAFQSEYQTQLRQQKYGVFGICIVQDIQTNTIFNRKDEYVRASTAKWQKRKGGYVV